MKITPLNADELMSLPDYQPTCAYMNPKPWSPIYRLDDFIVMDWGLYFRFYTLNGRSIDDPTLAMIEEAVKMLNSTQETNHAKSL